MKFEIWYRRVSDGRAPQFVNLQSEYLKGGVLRADSRREVEIKLAGTLDTTARIAGSRRGVKVGDVLIEHGVVTLILIYTATGAWAQVKDVSDRT